MGENKIKVSFAALDPYIETNIVLPTEKEVRSQDWIEWGRFNQYPEYLNGLYENCATLQSVINGCCEYVAGDGAEIRYFGWDKAVNKNGETITEIIQYIAEDYWKYGGFALNVIRNRAGNVAEIYYLNFANIRSDKKNEFLYYSEDWNKSYGRVKYVQYPKFNPLEKTVPTSIFYFKNTHNSVYPRPVYSAAVVACELEKKIDEYHINNISNNFMGNYIVNFNNGTPTDEIREEIEENFNEKFCGSENSGQPILSFNADKDHACSVEKIDGEDFGAKYESLAKRSRQQILTAFRATPILFGINTDGKGFAEEQFAEAFKLFNRTNIAPVQKKICTVFDKITGVENCLTIKPFTIDFTDDGDEVVEITKDENVEE